MNYKIYLMTRVSGLTLPDLAQKRIVQITVIGQYGTLISIGLYAATKKTAQTISICCCMLFIGDSICNLGPKLPFPGQLLSP